LDHKQADIIIVGNGLAGSILALQYCFKGLKPLVIDQPDLSLSSKVAAGIWNPVVFKRLTKSFLAKETLPYLQTFYAQAEKLLQQKLKTDMPIIKFFSEASEIQFWQKKANSDMQTLLDKEVSKNQYNKAIQTNAIAYAKVKQTGVLNTAFFLIQVNQYLKNKNQLINEPFDYKQLIIQSDCVEYQNISAKKVIFCEGYLVKDNPYFSYLPMKPVKGETITIEAPDFNSSEIINKGIFILPLGKHQYKVGATYNWEDLNDVPSKAGIEKLEQSLKQLITVDYKILKQEAGVRPATIDRRPIIGLHPIYPELGIFNGFGTKGVMLCPYLSEIFFNFISNAVPLPEEIDAKRFDHVYINKTT
jgi:glycine oxidase